VRSFPRISAARQTAGGDLVHFFLTITRSRKRRSAVVRKGRVGPGQSWSGICVKAPGAAPTIAPSRPTHGTATDDAPEAVTA